MVIAAFRVGCKEPFALCVILYNSCKFRFASLRVNFLVRVPNYCY